MTAAAAAITCLALSLAAPPPAEPGDTLVRLAGGEPSVTTADVRLRRGGLTAGDAPVDPADLLLWVADHHATPGAPHAARLRDGQVYLGELTAGDADGVTLQAEPWDTALTLPHPRLAELVWLRRPDPPDPRSAKPGGSQGVLHREGGPPFACTVERLDGRHLAVAAAFGRFTLPADQLRRFTYADDTAPPQPAGPFEVGLTDGALLHGAIEWTADGLTLTVAGLDPIELPARAVRHVRRVDRGLRWPAAAAEGDARVRLATDDLAPAAPPPWARLVTLRTGDTFAVSSTPAAAGLLHARVATLDGRAATLRVVGDAGEVAAADVGAATWQPVTVALPASRGPLAVRVTSDAPTTVYLADPVLVPSAAKESAE